MNQSSNGNQPYTNTSLLKGFFSRTSVLTLTIAMAILTVSIMIRTIVTGFSGSKVNMLSAVYYIFGDNSVSIVNIIFGTIISLISILFFASFLSIYLKAKGHDDDSSATGFSLLVFSSVTYVVSVIIILILAFASISVLRYESYQDLKQYDSREFSSVPNDIYTTGNAEYDFINYILFGTFAILLGVGAVRLSLAVKKAAMGEPIANRGGSLLLIGSIGSVALTCITFFIILGNLVIPNLSDDTVLEPSMLLSSILDIIIYAAASAVLYALLFLQSHYSILVSKLYRVPRATSYYASYATNVQPNAVRPLPMPPSNNNVTASPFAANIPQQNRSNPPYSQPYNTQPRQQSVSTQTVQQKPISTTPESSDTDAFTPSAEPAGTAENSEPLNTQ